MQEDGPADDRWVDLGRSTSFLVIGQPEMQGQESAQRSFFDASFAVEDLLEPESFYEVLYRHGHQLVSDEDFLECYDATTGRPSVPPTRMFKLVLLQFYEDLSDRQALERMAFDLRWKAVLGLQVHDGAVGQATLSEFRARLQLHRKMEEAFSRFLCAGVELGILSPDQVQLIDSTAIWGRGAVEDTYNLIGSGVRKLLGVAARRRNRKPEELAATIGLVLTAPGEGSLKGRAEIDWSDPEARRSFLNELVQEARRLLAETEREAGSDTELGEAAALLRRILVQDLEPAEAANAKGSGGGDGSDPAQAILANDAQVQIRHGVAKDRVVSVGDPEMRHGHKSHDRTWEGYKAHVCVDSGSEFITAVEVTAANAQDAAAVPTLMRQQQANGLCPVALVGDMAYSAAELRTWVSSHGSELVTRIPPSGGTKGCFRKDAFEIDLDHGVVTCPAGQTTQRFIARSSGERDFVFDGAVCASCGLRSQCTRKDPEQMRKTGRGRSLTLHALEHVLQQAREQENSPRVKQLLALRPTVERRLAHLVRRGMRQGRYFGKRKVFFQALTTALVVNLVRFATFLRADPGLCGRRAPSVA